MRGKSSRHVVLLVLLAGSGPSFAENPPPKAGKMPSEDVPRLCDYKIEYLRRFETQIGFKVTNVGTASCPTTTVQLQPAPGDSGLSGTWIVPALAVGASHGPIWKVMPGSVHWAIGTFVVDSEGKVREARETNNRVDFHYVPVAH